MSEPLGGKTMDAIRLGGELYILETDVREAINAALATNAQRNERIADLERSLSEAVKRAEAAEAELRAAADHHRAHHAMRGPEMSESAIGHELNRMVAAAKAGDFMETVAARTAILTLYHDRMEYAEKLKDAADERMVTLLMDAAFALSKVQPKNMLVGTLERAAVKLREAHKVVPLSMPLQR
jgi:hypothetical protein